MHSLSQNIRSVFTSAERIYRYAQEILIINFDITIIFVLYWNTFQN